jgi:hypothetical protein
VYPYIALSVDFQDWIICIMDVNHLLCIVLHNQVNKDPKHEDDTCLQNKSHNDAVQKISSVVQ